MQNEYQVELEGNIDRNAMRRLATMNHFEFPCLVTLIGDGDIQNYYCELTNVAPVRPSVFNWCNDRKIAYL